MSARPTTPIERDPARLADALPWYRNGTLADEDRDWVEAQLAADPAGREAAEFDRAIEAEFEARLAATPADIGWQKLLARARADDVLRRGVAAGGAGSGGSVPMRRLSSWFSSLLTPQLGMAMAALVVVQTLAIGYLVGDRSGAGDTVEYRSGAGQQPVPMIRALLNETTTEAALRAALLANEAVIVDGPNALGEYWILPAGQSVETVATVLRDAGVIASFAIDHRPRVR